VTALGAEHGTGTAICLELLFGVQDADDMDDAGFATNVNGVGP